MNRWRTILILILALGADARAELTIAEKGRSLYRIVIATNAIPSERYAAEELQRYLERLGGAKLLDIAEQLAGNQAERFRVQVARLPIWYVKLAAQPRPGEADSGRTAFGAFVQVELQEAFGKLVHFADLPFRRLQPR